MGCLDAPRMVLARMDVVTVAINCMAATCTDILFVSKLFEGRDRYTQKLAEEGYPDSFVERHRSR